MGNDMKFRVKESLEEIIDSTTDIVKENSKLLSAISKGIEETHKIANGKIYTEYDLGFAKGAMYIMECINSLIDG